MKKLTLVLFILVSLLIAFFAIKKYWLSTPEKTDVRSQTIFSATPEVEQVIKTGSDSSSGEREDTSLIPLLPNETLISVNSIDFDGDKFDDQVIAVESTDSPFIKIIVGLYSPFFGLYERSYELITDIEQVRTFSFTIMDITGTHQNALIINGYSSKGESLLQAWLPKKTSKGFELQLIADLQAEGTIFLDPSTRNDSYGFDKKNDGISFPIWAYTSDPSAPEGSLDQLHIMYNWDKNEQKYMEKTKKRIPGKTINAQELEKIQDGTEKTFAFFLDGLWGQPSGSTANTPYLFFDYAKKEIIFLYDDAQEIYSWERSTIRRNGILIYMVNKTMLNISRQFDIALISVDEIRVKVTDNLKMLISSATLWDGTYKKETVKKTSQNNISNSNPDIIKLLQTSTNTIWKSDNGYDIAFKGSVYTAQTKNLQEIGVFTVAKVQGETLLQFRSQLIGGFFSGFYRPQIIAPEILTENFVGTQLILLPVKITAKEIDPSVERALTLELKSVQDN